MLQDNTCYLLAVDFDEEGWREDAMAFQQSCEELNVPVSFEISRSGNGAHAWIFFSSAVNARDARQMGDAIISHTCARTRQLGFGNLIALPLQKQPRERGCSVFVDERLEPYADRWAYPASVQPMDGRNIEGVIFRATGGANPLDVAFIVDEDQVEPWKPPPALPKQLPGPMPTSLTLTLANQLHFEKEQLPQALLNRLIQLAVFQNPEFCRAQARGLSVWDRHALLAGPKMARANGVWKDRDGDRDNCPAWCQHARPRASPGTV